MRVLIVAQYYTPDITAAAFRIAETAELLSAWGHEVVVVTAEPHRVRAEDPSGSAPRGGQAVGASGSLPGPGSTGPTVRRVPIDPLEGSGLKPYLHHYFSFVLRARKEGRRVIKEGFRPDVVWVSSPPLFVGLVGPALRRAGRSLLWGHRPRFVLDIRDVWPDTAVAAGQISQGSSAYKVGRFLESWLYRRCEALSCVAAPMGEYLQGASGKEVAVVYNGVSEATLPQAGGSGGDGRREILYAGNLGRLQGLDVLLEAWSRVRDEPFFQEWTLRLLGSGVIEDVLREQIRQLQLEGRVVIDPPVAKPQALAAMEEAGLLFLNLRPDPVFEYTIPSKLFDYLRAGRPIVGGIPGEGAAILRETGGNATFPPGDVDGLEEALRHVAADYEEMRHRAAGNTLLVRERFTREAATRRLEELFRRVAGTS
ncbi:MAG: glycosyltransferase family 4 protein [Alkalispirochaetaceae bacterium]